MISTSRTSSSAVAERTRWRVG